MIAFIHEYNDSGKRTRSAQRVMARFCRDMTNVRVLEIIIPDKRKTLFRSIIITCAELERALASAKDPSR